MPRGCHDRSRQAGSLIHCRSPAIHADRDFKSLIDPFKLKINRLVPFSATRRRLGTKSFQTRSRFLRGKKPRSSYFYVQLECDVSACVDLGTIQHILGHVCRKSACKGIAYNNLGTLSSFACSLLSFPPVRHSVKSFAQRKGRRKKRKD